MTYIRKTVDNQIIIGHIYSDIGGNRGNNAVAVRVTSQGNIGVCASEYTDNKTDAYFTVEKVQGVIELLQRAITMSTEIKKLYVDLKTQESKRLTQIIEENKADD